MWIIALRAPSLNPCSVFVKNAPMDALNVIPSTTA